MNLQWTFVSGGVLTSSVISIISEMSRLEKFKVFIEHIKSFYPKALYFSREAFAIGASNLILVHRSNDLAYVVIHVIEIIGDDKAERNRCGFPNAAKCGKPIFGNMGDGACD